MSSRTSADKTWHADGRLSLPTNVEAWKVFDERYLRF